MSYNGKKVMNLCIHGDEKSECPFCDHKGDKKVVTDEEGKILSKKAQRTAAKIAKNESEPAKLNRATNRVLDQAIDIIKETEWPSWAEPEDWRMVAVHAIEKHFGRV